MDGIRLSFLWVLFFLSVPFTTQAASLYMEPQGATLNRGDTITVPIRLDTDEGECVNVIDAVVRYSGNIEPVDTSRGRSIVSIWVEDPVINKAERTITFAGGIPNGYCGRIPGDPRLTNTVIELLFRSPGMVVGAVSDSDVAEITFDEQSRVLLNDGFGTDAPLRLFGTTVTLSKQVGASVSSEWTERIAADQEPPEEFTIKLERTPTAFSNRYYIVFNTTDKQSGIDHYEVIEEPLSEQRLFNWGAATAPWKKTRSPYVLEDQTLNSTIRVRAVDKAGNEYVATLVPDESQRSLSAQSKVMIALVVTALVVFMLAAAVFWFWFWFRRKKNSPIDVNEYQDSYDDHE